MAYINSSGWVALVDQQGLHLLLSFRDSLGVFCPMDVYPCGAVGAGSHPTKGSETSLLQPSRGAKGGSERKAAERWGNEEC